MAHPRPWQTLRILAIQIAAALVALVPVLKKPTMILKLTSRGRQWRFAQGPTVRCQSLRCCAGRCRCGAGGTVQANRMVCGQEILLPTQIVVEAGDESVTSSASNVILIISYQRRNMKTLKPCLSLLTVVVIGTLVACSTTSTKAADVSDSIRTSQEHHAAMARSRVVRKLVLKGFEMILVESRAPSRQQFCGAGPA